MSVYPNDDTCFALITDKGNQPNFLMLMSVIYQFNSMKNLVKSNASYCARCINVKTHIYPGLSQGYLDLCRWFEGAGTEVIANRDRNQ